MKNYFDWKKYFFVFLITLSIFLLAIFLSSYFGERKVEQLKSIQSDIALDILSSEAQFSLLQDLSCKNISSSILSQELEELGKKLEWSENNLGNEDEVEYLKRYYSLLQIKDYLLSKEISERCGVKSAFVLYFYTTASDCDECEKQGIVLSSLREKYPELRVYSFDYSTNLSAVESMLQIYKIKSEKLPALVIGGDLFTGFQPISELEEIITQSFELQEALLEESSVDVDEKVENSREVQ